MTVKVFPQVRSGQGWSKDVIDVMQTVLEI